jgi:hypothetical protein
MGDFAILFLAQSLVPYGIDANDCSASNQMEPESELQSNLP